VSATLKLQSSLLVPHDSQKSEEQDEGEHPVLDEYPSLQTDSGCNAQTNGQGIALLRPDAEVGTHDAEDNVYEGIGHG